ncbi:MAG: adenine deaminase [Hespellia sp.]|nr:adenine deaminase [Hespellia sp.]
MSVQSQKEQTARIIRVAAGQEPADLVIKNCKIVDVYTASIIEGDIAICGEQIAGIGSYSGEEEIDAKGAYAAPGLIDSHIHIESSYVSPEEMGRLVVPHGTTTIIADPHEIANVCGNEGMEYMLEAAKGTALDIKYMYPSCVPSTPFENAGAILKAADMTEKLKEKNVLGLGEFMNYPGILGCDEDVLDKLALAKENGQLIDGHSPGLSGNDLSGYVAAGIHTDHECSSLEEMKDRLSRGVYVLLRQGSACHDLETLLHGVTPANSRRCLLCSDDRQPKTILEEGHIDNHLRVLVKNGIDAMTAIQMASLNAAECFRLYDRGAIAPGLRADLVLLDNLEDFRVQSVYIAGKKVAEGGTYLLPVQPYRSASVTGRMDVKNFSKERLVLPLKSSSVYTIDICPGGVLTKKGTAEVKRDGEGNFVFDPSQDIAKIAVVERHHGTGNVAVALLRGYGIKEGAIAVSIAHDSHNIIVVGVNDADMELAVNTLAEMGGGIAVVKNGNVIGDMPLPIAGLMSDQSMEWVAEKLEELHQMAFEQLQISKTVEPVMTLCFMSLAVIPELKLTDEGLFDVTQFKFIEIENHLTS